MKFTTEEAKKMIKDAPDECLITGLKKIEQYIFDEGVVYGAKMPYDAFTLPEYNSVFMSFSWIKIDMDADFRRSNEHLCELWEIVYHPKFDEIVKFYRIPDEDVKKAKEDRIKFDNE